MSEEGPGLDPEDPVHALAVGGEDAPQLIGALKTESLKRDEGQDGAIG